MHPRLKRIDFRSNLDPKEAQMHRSIKRTDSRGTRSTVEGGGSKTEAWKDENLQ